MKEEKHRSLDPDFAFIRKLCPHFSEDELREANVAFMHYVNVCLRIFDRLEEEERHRSSSPLTETDAKIRSDRSAL
jgi:hypothetical protein